MNSIYRLIITISVVATAAVSCGARTLFPKIKPDPPDIEVIKKEINDRTSAYYYPRLLEQFARNDTVMKLDKYRRLYLGYMLQEDYDPYRAPYPVPSRVIALYGKENPTRAECDSIIKYAALSLENDPFDMVQIDAMIDALNDKGNTNLARIWEYKLRYLLMAIVSTGTGLDEESAWFVSSPQHEYILLNNMGYKVDNHIFYEPYYEYITVEDLSGRDAGGYYFNLEPMLHEYYRKHPEETDESGSGPEDENYESDGAD